MDEEPEEKTRCTPGKKILAVALAVVLFFPAIALLLLWFLLGRSRLLVVLASAAHLAVYLSTLPTWNYDDEFYNATFSRSMLDIVAMFFGMNVVCFIWWTIERYVWSLKFRCIITATMTAGVCALATAKLLLFSDSTTWWQEKRTIFYFLCYFPIASGILLTLSTVWVPTSRRKFENTERRLLDLELDSGPSNSQQLAAAGPFRFGTSGGMSWVAVPSFDAPLRKSSTGLFGSIRAAAPTSAPQTSSAGGENHSSATTTPLTGEHDTYSSDESKGGDDYNEVADATSRLKQHTAPRERYQYVASGDGGATSARNPVLVLLHGFGAGKGIWGRRVMRTLETRFRVVALDWMGIGGSNGRLNPGYTASTAQQAEEFFIDAFEKWRHAFGLQEPFVLCGHSFGGYMATCYTMYAAKRHPGLITSLILVSPVGVPEPPTGDQTVSNIGPLANFPPCVRAIVGKLWNMDVTPNSFVRFLGPLGLPVARGLVKWRFGHLHANYDLRVLTEYVFHSNVGPVSGEVALTQILHPTIYARRPLSPRIVAFHKRGRDSGDPLAATAVAAGTSTCSTANANAAADEKRDVNAEQKGSTPAATAGTAGVTSSSASSSSSASAAAGATTPASREPHWPRTLFLYGEYDWMSVTAGKFVARELNAAHAPRTKDHSRVVIIPDAGHQLFMENPVDFCKEIFSFVPSSSSSNPRV